ncbi:MAG: hypothetical protein ABIS85_00615 [Pseudoxanthomonas sp.]
MTTDFAQLYLQLGIHNDCSLQEFKQACRRRIRQQHPDRMEPEVPGTSQPELAELLGLYAKALRFHRRHGRLPGAVAPAVAPPLTRSSLQSHSQPLPPVLSAYTPVIATPPAKRSLSARHAAVILAVAIAALTAFNTRQKSADILEAGEAAASNTIAPLPKPAVSAAQITAAASDGAAGQMVDLPAPPTQIEIGVNAGTVRVLQGNPTHSDEAEWTYGPSWIRFEDRRVVDWYSSPLRPLKTRTDSP